jgi:hypothetical protein
VLSEAMNEPTTNWPGLMVLTSLPTSWTMPTYSWPIGNGPSSASIPRYGHRSEPQTQVADSRMIASVGVRILGSSRSSTRTSPGAYITAPRMMVSLVLGSRSLPVPASLVTRWLTLSRPGLPC